MSLQIKKEQMKKIKEAYLKAKANGTITIRTCNVLHEAVLDSLNTPHTIKFENYEYERTNPTSKSYSYHTRNG